MSANLLSIVKQVKDWEDEIVHDLQELVRIESVTYNEGEAVTHPFDTSGTDPLRKASHSFKKSARKRRSSFRTPQFIDRREKKPIAPRLNPAASPA